MTTIREAKRDDLEGLLKLYTELNDNFLPEIDGDVISIWDSILNNPSHHVLVADDDGRLLSTCEVIIIMNLTRGQTPFAFIENVVTTSDHRGLGLGSSILSAAKDVAVDNGCHKIMLMTGHKEKSVTDFYERAGYNRNDKIGFVMWL